MVKLFSHILWVDYLIIYFILIRMRTLVYIIIIMSVPYFWFIENSKLNIIKIIFIVKTFHANEILCPFVANLR